jgi:hypothetical protein
MLWKLMDIIPERGGYFLKIDKKSQVILTWDCILINIVV